MVSTGTRNAYKYIQAHTKTYRIKTNLFLQVNQKEMGTRIFGT